jgi:folate-dependent phosphoribosylglycinamide formyltransferase PurN
MKAVILTGNQGNQRALCHKIADVCDVSAIVVSDNIPRRKPSLTKKIRTFLNRVENRLAGREFVETWFKLLGEYDAQFPDFPDVPIIRVKNVNDAATIEALEKYAPDLTIVSGTNLVGKKAIKASKKIVNLHTGISPYVKGGPNCTNWCLAKNWFHLIGNTVMWLDLGIDTGKIITTEQTPLDGSETLFELHWKVMEHAHDLYVRAVRQIGEGGEVPALPQDEISTGTTFYTADWNALAQHSALKNFRANYKNYFADTEKHKKRSAELKLVSLV